jgi:hemerythrin superfamily protein
MNDTSTQLPVRGADTVEILVNDHQIIKSLLSELVEAAAGKARRQVFDRLKGALVVHNATEENLVYPALRTIARKKMESEALYHETSEADILMFELDTMLKNGDAASFDTKARKLQKAILAHMDEEETIAFPQLVKKSDAEHAEALTTSVQEFRSALRFEP